MKRGIIIALLLLVIVSNVFLMSTYNKNSVMTSFTIFKSFFINAVTSVGKVFIDLGGATRVVYIDSPLNQTYNFVLGSNYSLNLNVSAGFVPTLWWYNLFDLRHGVSVYNNVSFSPNTTINAVRWDNRLEVYARDAADNIVNANVTFFIFVNNSAPTLNLADNETFVCEGSYISYYFNASDVDEDSLTGDINPKNPFYVFPVSFSVNLTRFEIVSGILSKAQAGGANSGGKVYDELLSVTDGQYSDSKRINITVIEINNIPSVDFVGVQTLWAVGNQSTWYTQVKAGDTEDGNQDSGNLIYNLTFLSGNRLFDISSNGVINVSANSSLIGVYDLSLCVVDSGIDNPHVNISLCGQDGGSRGYCQNFSLTVTDENRPPVIISQYPLFSNFSAVANDNLVFNVSKYDPDGTIPDSYWYADSISKKYYSGNSSDEFRYSFGCGVSGIHNISVEITDGLLNDSYNWTVTVSFIPCPSEQASLGGGGGGEGKPLCAEKWVCGDWQVCQNANVSLKAGLLKGSDYRLIKEVCSKNSWGDDSCGLQTKFCGDVANCNSSRNKPAEVQACYYTQHPSCNDGIKNCHDDSCELLIDCGGPCGNCPTCSDKIQNQGEEGIDCGGPCPWKCQVEMPEKQDWKFCILKLIILILVIIIIIRIKRIIEHLREIKKKR